MNQMVAEKRLRQADIMLLEGVLQRTHGYAQQLDSYANIMIALSSAVFIFSFSELQEDHSLFWLFLGTTMGVATILSLLLVRPPRALRKRGQIESAMYSRRIVAFGSPEAYRAELARVLGSGDEMLTQYSREIYNLTRYYYLPKKFLFRWANVVLMTGMSVSLLLFLFDYLGWLPSAVY